MTDEERQWIVSAYMITRPGDDMPIPEETDPADAMIFVAHLQEIGYGHR